MKDYLSSRDMKEFGKRLANELKRIGFDELSYEVLLTNTTFFTTSSEYLVEFGFDLEEVKKIAWSDLSMEWKLEIENAFVIIKSAFS